MTSDRQAHPDEPLLAPIALEHAAPTVRAQIARVADLEGALREMCSSARATHPAVVLPGRDFVAYVVERLDPARPDAGLSGLAVADLYIALACARGDVAAIDWVEHSVLADTRNALAEMRLPATAIDELIQRVRHKLFIADVDAPARLTTYAGRGSLRRWVRSIAVRMALNSLRTRDREVSLEQELMREIDPGGADPASEHIKQRYREQFQRSLTDAMRSLSARQRNALRLHLIDGVTLDQLAALYRVHRATVARWLASSRQQLVDRTLADVGQKLGSSRTEAESLLRLILSRLDVTLGEHTATDAR